MTCHMRILISPMETGCVETRGEKSPIRHFLRIVKTLDPGLTINRQLLTPNRRYLELMFRFVSRPLLRACSNSAERWIDNGRTAIFFFSRSRLFLGKMRVPSVWPKTDHLGLKQKCPERFFQQFHPSIHRTQGRKENKQRLFLHSGCKCGRPASSLHCKSFSFLPSK